MCLVHQAARGRNGSTDARVRDVPLSALPGPFIHWQSALFFVAAAFGDANFVYPSVFLFIHFACSTCFNKATKPVDILLKTAGT